MLSLLNKACSILIKILQLFDLYEICLFSTYYNPKLIKKKLIYKVIPKKRKTKKKHEKLISQKKRKIDFQINEKRKIENRNQNSNI